MRREELVKIDEEMIGAWMDQNVEVIMSHCADDVVNMDFGQEPVRGKEALRDYLSRLFGPFTENKYESVKRLIDGNELFAEILWSGKHTGDLPMPDGTVVPATGKPVQVTAAYYARVNDDGQIVEMRGYTDTMSMLAQLGLTG